MTAEEKIKQVMGRETTCPICSGSGEDPIQRSHKGPDPAKCRRCHGDKTINRLAPIHQETGTVEGIVLKEEILPDGTQAVQYQALSVFVENHRGILERPDPQLTMKDHLEEIKKGTDHIMKGCIDTWIGEGRI